MTAQTRMRLRELAPRGFECEVERRWPQSDIVFDTSQGYLLLLGQRIQDVHQLVKLLVHHAHLKHFQTIQFNTYRCRKYSQNLYQGAAIKATESNQEDKAGRWRFSLFGN